MTLKTFGFIDFGLYDLMLILYTIFDQIDMYSHTYYN